MQTTSHLLMIRPAHFGFNAETAVNNAFQVPGLQTGVAEKALAEFDAFVALLRAAGVQVTVVEDSPKPHTPDAIFPNNWISFHEGGLLCLYPMFAVNRRLERKAEVLQVIRSGFQVLTTEDFTVYEKAQQFLEGTGSMVLDRENRIAYACISPRTHPDVLADFCRRTGFTSCVFHAVDARGAAIYHTNVLMCVGDGFVLICLDAIVSADEKAQVKRQIEKTGRELIPISAGQLAHFAGNMLHVHSADGKKWIVLSQAARNSLDPDQIKRLSRYGDLLSAPLTTIEANGGGSARCMMAEVFLEPKQPAIPF